MNRFSNEAAASVERIQKMGAAIDGDLKGLLAYFGEQSEVSPSDTDVTNLEALRLTTCLVQGPESTRPEDFFSMVLSFSLALQKAAAEVTKHLAPSISPSARPVSPSLLPFAPCPTPLTLSPSFSQPFSTRPSALANSAPPAVRPNPSLAHLSSPAKTVGKGDLDEAIRSLHGGQRRTRERDASQSTRPLSKIFVDGSAGNSVRRGTIGTRRREAAATSGRPSLGGLFDGK